MKAPIIETPRLVLRPWRDEDVPHFVEMHGDPRVMEFYPSTYSADYSRALAARARSNREQRGYGWWIAEIKDGSRFAGASCSKTFLFQRTSRPRARWVGVCRSMPNLPLRPAWPPIVLPLAQRRPHAAIQPFRHTALLVKGTMTNDG
jgi:RimJ/RimL family protein N-acetyltransferase